jgi:hypothetical protein
MTVRFPLKIKDHHNGVRIKANSHRFDVLTCVDNRYCGAKVSTRI